LTNYVAVVGEGTLWCKDVPRDLSFLKDKVDHKILLIEIPCTDIVWTEPRDITLDEALQLFSSPDGLRGTDHGDGLSYITVSLQVRPISSIRTIDEFKSMLCTPERQTEGQTGTGTIPPVE
jgi:hypothetical protein